MNEGIKEQNEFVTTTEREFMYNLGYQQGYEAGVRDMEQKAKKYYQYLSGKSMTEVVQYTVGLMAKELIEGCGGLDNGGRKEEQRL